MTEVEEGVAGWSAHAEEVLSWLLEAEDHLAGLNSLGQKHLMTVKTRHAAHTAHPLSALSSYSSTRIPKI
jgi:hypothetical protein